MARTFAKDQRLSKKKLSLQKWKAFRIRLHTVTSILTSDSIRNCTNGIQTASLSPHNASRREIEHVEGNFGTPENGPRQTLK